MTTQRLWTTDIGAHVGERVRLTGWLHRVRQLSSVSFLLLRDALGIAQIVVDEPATIEQLSRLYNESVLRVEGTVVAAPQAPGGVELHAPAIEVLSPSAEPPPLDLFRLTP